MDFTTSDAYATDTGTGHRLHQDTAPVTTQVSARDMNMVIWSLMKVLADGGISAATFNPADPATYNRVSLAVQALAGVSLASFTGSNQSLGTNGYQKLPGGTILQRGVYTADISIPSSSAATPVTITFPVAFPTACRAVALTPRNPTNDAVADSWPELVSRSTTSMSVSAQNAGGSGTDFTLHGFDWIAFGD
jgi:hypothetical protein